MAEEKKQKFKSAEGGAGGGPGARGGFQKPKDTKKTIRRILTYLTARKLPLVLVAICLIVSTVSSIAGSYMMRPILNDLVAAGTISEKVARLTTRCVFLFLLYLCGSAATYLQANLMARTAQNAANKLRSDLFNALEALPLTYFDQHPHGELMSRFTNDADNVSLAMEQSFVNLISSVLTFVGIVAVMIYTSPLLFIITALTLFASVMVFKVLGGKSRKYYRKQQAALGQVNGEIQEVIEGLKVVKAFSHEKLAKEEFDELNRNYRDAAMDANFYSGVIFPINVNLTNIGFAITAIFGGFLALVRGFDLGGFAVYLNYSRQVGQPIQQVSQQLTAILSALAGAERIFAVMDTVPEVNEGTVTLVPAEKDANGTLRERFDGGRGLWAWKTPRHSGMALVPVLVDADENLTELGQAAREDGGRKLRLLAPHEDSPEGIWVTVAADGSLREVEDLSTLAGHGWAWKYPDHEGRMTLHLIRGTVRNVPGEDYYLTELRGAVRFSHVDFSYVPGKRVLHDVTVYANPGQKIAFVGSTGAGKTTITNLINRFYEIEGGLITYDGIDVKAIRKDDLRHSLGAVLQDTHLFTGTVMDNIRYGRLDATDEECIAAAKSANAHSFIRRLPDGYNTMVTGDGANLSQGQRQLLAIARAAVADPPVMVLDEATSSIDTRTEQHIQQGMDRLMEGRTVFVIAHRLSTVRNSDCIVVIEHGQIQEKGDHEELLAEKGRYYLLYTGQHILD